MQDIFASPQQFSKSENSVRLVGIWQTVVLETCIAEVALYQMSIRLKLHRWQLTGQLRKLQVIQV